MSGGERKVTFPSLGDSSSRFLTAGALTNVMLESFGDVQSCDLASAAPEKGRCWMEMSHDGARGFSCAAP